VRNLPAAVAALGMALALSACVYVERTAPARPARVLTTPDATVVTPGVVTPAPPGAVIVR
jgi:hypothetical protein